MNTGALSRDAIGRAAHSASRGARLRGGGTAGNRELTALTGVVLLVLLAVLGVTILRIGQLLWLHLYVGLVLIGPVTLKLASTGYRFVRYYARSDAYRRQGPPPLVLRMIGPLVVLTTVSVLATGVVLLLLGPAQRGSWVLFHKASFIAWGVFMALHVLGHLPGLPHDLRAVRRTRAELPGLSGGLSGDLSGPSRGPLRGPDPGGMGRYIAVAGALIGGLVVAILLLPEFAAWTHGVFIHHGHGHG